MHVHVHVHMYVFEHMCMHVYTGTQGSQRNRITLELDLQVVVNHDMVLGTKLGSSGKTVLLAVEISLSLLHPK